MQPCIIQAMKMCNNFSDFANSAEQRRQELLKEALEEGIEEDEKSELGSISKETEDASL